MDGRLRIGSTGCGAAWLARLLWEQEAAGSNPAIPTNLRHCRSWHASPRPRQCWRERARKVLRMPHQPTSTLPRSPLRSLLVGYPCRMSRPPADRPSRPSVPSPGGPVAHRGVRIVVDLQHSHPHPGGRPAVSRRRRLRWAGRIGSAGFWPGWSPCLAGNRAHQAAPAVTRT